MSTHPHEPLNGVPAKLRKLLDHHERIVASLRTTIGLLSDSSEDPGIRKRGILEDALALDATRGTRKKLGRPRKVHATSFETGNGDSPSPVKVKRGRKTTRATAADSGGAMTNEAQMARRQVTADLLASFDPKEPRPSPGKGQSRERSVPVGVLVYHGYLKKKGKDGYVRTAKPFHVNQLPGGRVLDATTH